MEQDWSRGEEFFDIGPRDTLILQLRRFKRGRGGMPSMAGRTTRLIRKLREWPDSESIPSLDSEDFNTLRMAEDWEDPSTALLWATPTERELKHLPDAEKRRS